MANSTVSEKWHIKVGRNVKIPPVYLFLIFVFFAGGLLDLQFSGGQILKNPAVMMNIIVRSVALGIVAVGQTLVIIGASIDLSVAYTIGFTSVISSFMMQGDPERVPMAIGFVILCGVIIGFANGFLVTKVQVNPLVATLGTGLIIKGIITALFSNYTGGVPISFEFMGYATVGPIPVSVVILLVVVLIGWFILMRTKFGTHLYAVGGSVEVSRLSGLRTDRLLIFAHIFCSLTAVLTGLFLVSRMRSGSPWIGTDGLYDLESIAATVIGGTALAGGKGGVWGTLAGVLIFGILDTTFSQLGVNPYLKSVFRGAIIILAVASYTMRSKKEAS